MNRNFSLRRRLVFSLFGVFLLGVAATAVYFRWELAEIGMRLRQLPEIPDVVTAQFNQMVEVDIEFLGFILVPFTFAAIAVILVITQWSLQGIRRTSSHATHIDIERLDARLDAAGLPNEIVPLVHAMNGTLNRLAVAYAIEQRLTANAAHELRTPLAVLQTRLQKAKFDATFDWPAIERDLAQLNRIVSQILELARKESRHPGGTIAREALNLARVLREAAAQVLPLAETMNRSLEINAPDRILVEGCADDLRDMLRNLLENALHHGRGAVRGSVSYVRDHDRSCAVVTVTDEGDGVPESLHETMFERFSKLSTQSMGAGLGLAIVRQVARDHGGDAKFASGIQGIVCVTLPAMTEDPSAS